MGELGHIDCYYLPRGLVENDKRKLYLFSLIDDHSRIAWSEVIYDLKSLTVMMALIRCLTALNSYYGITFEEILTDNGPEMGSGKFAKNQMTNPVKRILYETDIKQRYTKPYRSQTNGKVERLWRTMSEEFLDGCVFTSEEELRNELVRYLINYNEYRPHQGISGKKPHEKKLESDTNV
jgi:transposase InsO family protein